MERIAGFEPALSAWKAEVLALKRYPHTVVCFFISKEHSARNLLIV